MRWFTWCHCKSPIQRKTYQNQNRQRWQVAIHSSRQRFIQSMVYSKRALVQSAVMHWLQARATVAWLKRLRLQRKTQPKRYAIGANFSPFLNLRGGRGKQGLNFNFYAPNRSQTWNRFHLGQGPVKRFSGYHQEFDALPLTPDPRNRLKPSSLTNITRIKKNQNHNAFYE